MCTVQEIRPTLAESSSGYEEQSLPPKVTHAETFCPSCILVLLWHSNFLPSFISYVCLGNEDAAQGCGLIQWEDVNWRHTDKMRAGDSDLDSVVRSGYGPVLSLTGSEGYMPSSNQLILLTSWGDSVCVSQREQELWSWLFSLSPLQTWNEWCSQWHRLTPVNTNTHTTLGYSKGRAVGWCVLTK